MLLEPRADDYRMFFTNIFSFSSRRAVCEHAYQETRRELLRRADELGPIFARHGLRLRTDLLTEERDLWEGVALPDRPQPADRLTDQPADRPADPTLEALAGMLDQLDAVLAEAG